MFKKAYVSWSGFLYLLYQEVITYEILRFRISVIFTFQPNSQRLNNTINNAQPDVILVNEDFEIEFDNVINVSRLDLSEGNDSRIEWKEHQADDTAYIIYTSGSTGNPKGVVTRQ